MEEPQHQCKMKYKFIIGLMLVMLLVAPMVSAWEFEHIKELRDDGVIEIRDSILKIPFTDMEKVAEVKLVSNNPNYVMPGKDRNVIVWDITSYDDGIYENALKELEVLNMKTDSYEDKEFYFAKAVYEDVEVNDYEDVCVIEKNLTESCVKTLSGKHSESRITSWERLDTTNLEKGTTRIALVTDVAPGDYFDGIPTFFGVRIEEHAVWTEALNTNIEQYFAFEDGSGTTASDSTGNQDGTWTSAPNYTNGIINIGVNTSTARYIDTGINIPNSSDFSISIWLNSTSVDNYNDILGQMDSNDGPGFMCRNREGTKLECNTYDSALSNTYTTGFVVGTSTLHEWYHFVLVYIASEERWNIYTDNVLRANGTGEFGVASNNLWVASSNVVPAARFWRGEMDEYGYWSRALSAGSGSEIEQLYNGGVGITYSDDFASAPDVTLNSPATETNFTTTSVTMNCSATDDDSDLLNLSLWVDGALDTTVTNSTAYENLSLQSTNVLGQGGHNWSCSASDLTQKNTTVGNSTFIIDSIVPATEIIFPVDGASYLDSTAETNGATAQINWTVSDTNLQACWYYNNSENVTVTCGANATITLPYGTYTHYVYANDSFGNENLTSSSTATYAFTFKENSQTYNTSTIESSTEGFSIDINYSSSEYSVVTANLIYNGTTNLGTRTGTGDHAIFKKVITIPEIKSQANKTFYWAIGLTNSSGTNWFNSTSNNQTIDIMNMSLCGDPYNVPFINFTIKDEDNGREINGTFKTTLSYGTSTEGTKKEFSYEYTANASSRFNFCMTPPDKTYFLTSTLEYAAPGYSTKFFDFQNLEVTNATTETNLYLLNESDSTSFIIKVRDSGFVDVPNAEVRVQRYDVGSGSWLTTEIVITNYEGKAVGHLLTEDANYRFLVYVGGSLALESGSTKIVCEVVPCTVTLTIASGVIEEIFPYEDLDSLSTSLTYTETTNIFTYSYQDSSSDFIESRLLVQRVDVGGGDLLAPACNVTLTDPSGVITCDISSTVNLNGTYVATGFNSRTGELNYQTDRIVVKKFTTIANTVGPDGVLWGIFFMITVVMLGVYRPSLGIIFAMIGFLILSIMRLIDISVAAVAALILIGVILLIEVRRQ